MNLKNIEIPKNTKMSAIRLKWENDIKKAEAEWAERINKRLNK